MRTAGRGEKNAVNTRGERLCSRLGVRAQSGALIAGRVMPSDYTETERICCCLELERACLRMTLGPGSIDLRQVEDVHLRRLLLADFEHAKRRLPEVECELLALKAFGKGTASFRTAAVVLPEMRTLDRSTESSRGSRHR